MTRQEKLLVISLGAGSLHTSAHQREYVRLSAAGLVERKPSFLHKNEVSLTERGKEARRLFTIELLPFLRAQMPAHDEFQRVRNKSKKPCPCGECWAVREHDRANIPKDPTP